MESFMVKVTEPDAPLLRTSLEMACSVWGWWISASQSTDAERELAEVRLGAARRALAQLEAEGWREGSTDAAPFGGEGSCG